MPPTADITGEMIPLFPIHEEMADAAPQDELGDRIDDCGPGAPRTKIVQLELSEARKAVLADHIWLNEQYNDGALDAYSGEYVAVVEKQVLGHGKKQLPLREEVSKATGHPTGRIVIMFVDRNMIDSPLPNCSNRGPSMRSSIPAPG